MKAAAIARYHDGVELIVHLWLRLRLAIVGLQLRLVKARRRQATADLVDAGVARMQAQLQYADQVQCLDSRSEYLLQQLIAINAELQTEELLAAASAPVWSAWDFSKEQLIENEIDALYRIAAFKGKHCVAMPGDVTAFYTIRLQDDDTLLVEVDFFLQRLCSQPSYTRQEMLLLDDLTLRAVSSEDLMLRLVGAPATREGYKLAHRLARALLTGRPVLGPSSTISRQKFLQQTKAALDRNCVLAPVRLVF